MNKRDYRSLEREYVTSDISIRELCRRHDISAHSLVTVQAKKGKWQEKREAYQAKASEAFLTRHAAKMADRQAELEDKALDVIDQALDKFREDMHATERKRIDGEWVEVPVMRLTPKDVAILIDRLQILFDRPSSIRQQQGLEISAEVTPDALREFIEATRGMGRPTRTESSPLPRT